MPEEKELHEKCYFRENQKELEEALLKRVRQMLNLEYDSLASQFEEYKAEQMKAIEAFKKTQDETLAKFKDELIEYFKNKFEPNFTQSIFEMNKALVEKVINGNYELKKMQMEGDTKNNEIIAAVEKKKLEVWQYVLVALFGAFGVKLVEFLMGLFK